ncbi:LAME_0C07822g1_1 [Lachancea meyersii CBS 8951]|uniref:LAME_0C07822g1_1 n=1 Tax=Lachancea meyersii CBS 8951 TaxID=1266667 RepID=A0A1G4J384_9SACH|nr:LAME_0C07822g1_1 [Lachancea meyersii CBS 8951]
MSGGSRQKILEINGCDKISLPFVKFPPFKLRAAMVEKDPVIWLHLLETYNQYFAYLMCEGRLELLDDSTYENMCLFVRQYLRELSDEEGKLLSLGMNNDVQEQLQLLRRWILALVKDCGLLHLQISCDTLWDFVKLYARDNPATVRSLVQGTLKPKINTQKAHLNRTYQLHQHLKQLVDNSRFSRVDLKALESLLSDKERKRANSFANQFLTAKWAETLESWFKQDSKFIIANAKNLGILTYVCASENRIVEVMSELNVNTLETLQLYPLMASLLLNNSSARHPTGLRSKLPFLRPLLENKIEARSLTIKSEDVLIISELFPSLTQGQIVKRLQVFHGNVDRTIESLFDDPLEAEEELTYGAPVPSTVKDLKTTEFQSELKKSDRVSKETVSVDHVPDEVRNKTLTRALSLLYQADEDEKDDTYDDAEAQPMAVPDEGSKSNSESSYEKAEGYLWELLKDNKTLFERSGRGSKTRKDMKFTTSWSDEQIEGWARMLERSPKRAQVLEEKYMFKGNVRTGKRAFVQNRNGSGDDRNNSHVSKDDQKTQPRRALANGPGNKPRQNAKKEKNKASRANHNRKTGHDKKMSKVMP